MRKFKIWYKIIKYNILYKLWSKLYDFSKYLEWKVMEPMYDDPDLQDYFDSKINWSGN